MVRQYATGLTCDSCPSPDKKKRCNNRFVGNCGSQTCRIVYFFGRDFKNWSGLFGNYFVLDRFLDGRCFDQSSAFDLSSHCVLWNFVFGRNWDTHVDLCCGGRNRDRANKTD